MKTLKNDFGTPAKSTPYKKRVRKGCPQTVDIVVKALGAKPLGSTGMTFKYKNQSGHEFVVFVDVEKEWNKMLGLYMELYNASDDNDPRAEELNVATMRVNKNKLIGLKKKLLDRVALKD